MRAACCVISHQRHSTGDSSRITYHAHVGLAIFCESLKNRYSMITGASSPWLPCHTMPWPAAKPFADREQLHFARPAQVPIGLGKQLGVERRLLTTTEILPEQVVHRHQRA